jgi:hypothetical protein
MLCIYSYEENISIFSTMLCLLPGSIWKERIFYGNHKPLRCNRYRTCWGHSTACAQYFVPVAKTILNNKLLEVIMVFSGTYYTCKSNSAWAIPLTVCKGYACWNMLRLDSFSLLARMSLYSLLALNSLKLQYSDIH